LAIAFILGFILGARKPKNDGFIYLEKNEQGDDRIRFYLNMEYDDIAQHDTIQFKVVKEKAM
jgi:hypothetical protein